MKAKTKEQLQKELADMRQTLATLQASETERKRAEEALRESEARYRSLFENSVMGISQALPDGRLICANTAYAQMYGYANPDEMMAEVSHIGRQLYANPEDREEVLRILKEKGVMEPREIAVVRRDGTRFFVLVGAREVRDSDGNLRYYQAEHVDITECKRAEEALRKSEERYRRLVESSDAMLFNVDRAGVFKAAGGGRLREFGLRSEDVVGRSLYDLFPSEEARRYHEQQQQVFESGTTMIFENTFEFAGQLKTDLVTTYPIKDEGGNVELAGVICHDITERKRTEEALHKSENLLRTFLSAVKESAFVVDPEGIVMISNETLAQRLGTSVNELIGTCIYKYLSPEIARGRKTEVDKVIRMGEPSHYEDRRAGMWIDSFVYPIFDEEGRVVNVGVIAIDITERKRVEEELRISEQNLTRAQRIGCLGNWDWDVKNWTLTWSDEIYRIFGVEKGTFALTYESIEAMIHPDDRAKNQKKVNELLATADVWELELRIVRPDGAIRHIYQSAEVARDHTGTVTRIFGIMQDITERKRAEEELKTSHEQLRNLAAHLEAIREEERTRIAREIHDELGQTLTALKMDISWLKKRCVQDQTTFLEKVKTMETLLDSMIKVIKRLATELRPGLLDDLGLSAAIAWQTEEFQQRTGIQCAVIIAPEEIIVKENISTAVFRIFQETLTNVVRHAQATHVHVLLRKEVDKLFLEVKDNGKGITAAQIANPKSFGLIGIRERTQFLGGQVTFQGIPNQGTTVTVTIPLG